MPRSAGAAELKSRFKAIVASDHPDKHPGDAAAAERFKELKAAYEEAMADLSGGLPRDDAAEGAAKPRARSEKERVRDAEQKWRDAGFDPQSVRIVRDVVSVFANVGIVGSLLYIAYIVVFSSPEALLNDIFKSSPGVPDEDLIRLGFKDTPEMKEFYKDYERRYGPRVPANNDREWLEEQEKLIEGPDMIEVVR